jgi:ABC-type branched-subunit amino acid transport system substrate-binding protein
MAINEFSVNQFLFTDGISPAEITRMEGIDNLEMCGTIPGKTESQAIFKKNYEDEYGESEVLYLPNVYDAVVVAGLAAYAAQAIGEEVTPITIRDYLRRVNDPNGQKVLAGSDEGLQRAMKMLDSGFTINYEGASGNVDFDENGDVIAPIDIWCYEDGEIVDKDLENF